MRDKEIVEKLKDYKCEQLMICVVALANALRNYQNDNAEVTLASVFNVEEEDV